MATKVVLSSFIRAWFIYQHRAVFGKLQGTSLPVNCRIIFNWIPEKESAEVSSTFMWLKVTSVGEFYKHGDENLGFIEEGNLIG
jgi:sugar phosphate permease